MAIKIISRNRFRVDDREEGTLVVRFGKLPRWCRGDWGIVRRLPGCREAEPGKEVSVLAGVARWLVEHKLAERVTS